MKTRVDAYTFDASAKQVTLTGLSVELDRLYLIVNATDGIIIYNFADANKNATAAGDTFTLEYDTTAMDDADSLVIVYDDAAASDVISGTVTVIDGGGTISVDDAAGTLTVDNPILSVVGGGVEATAQRVTLASDSTGVLSVDDNGSTLSVDDGGGTLTVDNAALAIVGGGAEATALRVTLASDSTGLVSVDDNGGSLTVDGSVTADTELTTADLDTGAGSDTRAVVGLVYGASGGALPVNAATPLPVKEIRSATPGQTSPSVTTSSTTVLASNAARLGATIWNEGAATCLVKLGATASATSYSVQLTTGSYYEVPFGFTGVIDGIVASGTAQLRVTELAA